MGVTVKNFLGGVGGLVANIYITGLNDATDTVSAVSPSGKTIQAVWGAYVIEGVITQCFKISASEYGTYNITAIRDTKTKTAEVLVDVATDYEVPMAFELYLYNAGDECISVTGGWIRHDTNPRNYFEKYSDRMYLHYDYTGAEAEITTVNDIAFSGYTKLHIKFNLASYVDGTNNSHIYSPDEPSLSFKFVDNSTDTSMKESEYSLSALQSYNGKVMIYAYDTRINIYELWLE